MLSRGPEPRRAAAPGAAPQRSRPGWVHAAAWVGSFLWLEFALRLGVDADAAGGGPALALLFAASAGLALALVSSFLRGRAARVVLPLALVVVTVVYASQYVYFQVFRTFYSLYSAGNAGQVAEFAADILAVIGENAGQLALLGLPPLAGVVLLARRGPVSTSASVWRRRAAMALALALSHAGGIALVNAGDREPNSAWDLYHRSSYPVASVSQLGLVTTMRLDLQRNVLGLDSAQPDPLGPPPPPAPVAPGSADPTTPGPGAPTPGATASASARPPTYHTLDIDFAALESRTSDPALKSAHAWFGQRRPTAHNAHTGRYEGYNLVLVTAEGYSHYAVDRELTPTLYKMTHEGVNFTNFYNPLWGVSTSDGEYVALTGLIPKPGVWSLARSGDNAMPYVLGNQLKQRGYATRAYHNHTYDYYDRHLSHPNLGYTYQGIGNGLDIEKTWPESDVEMVEETVDAYRTDEPFHTYYMTVSGHLRYTFGGNFIARKNRALVEDLPYTEGGKAYLATQIELDRALELLLAELTEAGVAERTLIAVSADHYPYGLTKPEIDDLAGHRVEPDFELSKSSFLLYTPGMTPETVDRPVSSLDILPTLSNLMGLEYDSRLLMGSDAFSDADPLVIFNNRSFLTDRGRYNARTREFTPAPGATVPEGYREQVSADVDRRFYFSRLVLDSDYYGRLAPR